MTVEPVPRRPAGRGHLVCGMHRSGTSMVAALLQASGVHLGAPGELIDAADDNPRGFAEHRVAVDIDDRLLAAQGGAWDLPPAEADWSADRLGGLRHRAAALLADLSAGSATGHWGLKDPRLSLTLPFWRELVADHRVVVCVRNPLEVAASLAERNGISVAMALQLWEAHHRSIDAELPSTHRIVVHYAAMLADPVGQTDRLLRALGIDADAAIAPTCVDRGDRHHRFGSAELRAVGAPPEVVERYLALCAEAGWTEPATGTGIAAPPPAPPGTGIDLDAVARVRLEAELALRGGHIDLLRAEVRELSDVAAAAAAGSSAPTGEPTLVPAPAAPSGRALVVQHRLPEFDRDRGSVRVLELVEGLLDGGWQVDFWALDVPADRLEDEEHRRHLTRLVDLGVMVHAGDTGAAEELIAHGELDLCVAAFWHVGARVLPLVRATSPRTRVVVDSVDLHLLRESRRRLDQLGAGGMGSLDDDDGARFAAELNVYAGADAVLTVSQREARLVDDFVGREGLGHVVPLGDSATPSPFVDADQRRGVAFVGNFRHLPNVEAVEHLCAAVLPRLDPELLAAHPVRVIGHGLDERVAQVGAFPHVELVGWVEDVEPHLHEARVSVVPLLHGAGVKGKVIQSLLAGTPVVSTPVGVEGLELPTDGVAPVVVVADAHDMAVAVEALLGDDELWRAHRDAGLEWARTHHGRDVVAAAVQSAVARVVAAPAPVLPVPLDGSSRRWLSSYEEVRTSVRDALAAMPADAEVLVASGGDAELLDDSPVTARHFPRDATGAHLGRNPSGAELVEQLEQARRRGATHLVVPSTHYWWWHHHPELREWCSELPPMDERRDCRVLDLCPEPTMVHVDPAVQDPEVAAAHLREVLATAATPVVHMPVDHVTAGVAPPLVRQRGLRGRTMVGLGAGPATAARGEATVAALVAALGGDAQDLHQFAATIDDAHPVHLLAPVEVGAPSQRCRIISLLDLEDRVHHHDDPGTGREHPAVSVVIATRDRSVLLDRCLASLAPQAAGRDDVELVVVDDGSTDDTAAVVDDWSQRLPIRRSWLPGAGRSAAKNLGVMLARGDSVLLLDDDDRLLDGALDAYLAARDDMASDVARRTAVLGHTDWAPELARTQLMHHVTEVGCQFFSYPLLPVGEPLDWRHFWEGRLLVDRGLLMLEGLHDDRLEYSVDVELARRLDRVRPIAVRYEPAARGVMARPVDLASVLRRARAKGVAQRTILDLHPDDEELVRYCTGSDTAPEQLVTILSEARRIALAASVDEPTEDLEAVPAVAAAIDRAIRAATDLGLHGVDLPEPTAPSTAVPPARAEVARPRPELSVIVPVWSLTAELAVMATETLRRVREVAALGTEIVVIDNGSPVATDLSAADRVVTLTHNRGVGPAWNLGASLAAAPLLCFLNSDCEVTPGWDRALSHAATDGRRIAFPYTDHVDGHGPTSPDQAGTAGWCFMLHRELFGEIGAFDEDFAPAYFEDTDYWHRAWEMGVDLSPVPAAVVVHQRRTTGRHAPELAEVFERNRRRYEAKHGVEHDAPPPFYSRDVVEYPPSGRHRLARLRPWASTGEDRPRVFGIGLNKTGTSSLHAAVSHLGFSSVHHGGALGEDMARARREGRPMVSVADPGTDAFFDIEAIRCGYAELDRDHPGSKFILSVRDLDTWLASRVRHVERNLRLRAAGLPHGDFLEIDLDGWTAERAAHHEAVMAHFAGRPDDLLVIDVCGGQGWERLAPFLGWGRLPERVFPWENRDLGTDVDADLVAPERR